MQWRKRRGRAGLKGEEERIGARVQIGERRRSWTDKNACGTEAPPAAARVGGQVHVRE
jgi:hypothetical protein